MIYRTMSHRLPVLCVLLACSPLTAQQAPAAHPLFEGDAVHEIRLTFSQPDWWARLRANFEGQADPTYLEASFDWGETHFDTIGVRFKGNSSYRSYPGDKKSFKIKLNAFVKGQKVAGIDSLNLNNAFKDPSFVREKVYYELAVEAGLAAPRVNHAAVYINGEYWGLYFLVEGVDSAFLESRFGKKESGNLYKGDPQGTLQWRGPAVQPYRNMFEKENNEDADDWSDLVKLIDTLNNQPLDALRGVLDVDSAAALLALDLLTVNLDSYIGSGHNYYLYHRVSDGRFVLMPWDPNEAWGNFNLGIPIEQLRRLPLNFMPQPMGPPGQPPPPQPPGGSRPLASKLWADPDTRAAYRDKVRSLLAGAAHPDTLLARMQALRDLVRPWVEMDVKKMYPTSQFESCFLEDFLPRPVGPPLPGGPNPPPNPGGGMPIPGLSPFIRERAVFLSGELEKP